MAGGSFLGCSFSGRHERSPQTETTGAARGGDVCKCHSPAAGTGQHNRVPIFRFKENHGKIANAMERAVEIASKCWEGAGVNPRLSSSPSSFQVPSFKQAPGRPPPPREIPVPSSPAEGLSPWALALCYEILPVPFFFTKRKPENPSEALSLADLFFQQGVGSGTVPWSRPSPSRGSCPECVARM